MSHAQPLPQSRAIRPAIHAVVIATFFCLVTTLIVLVGASLPRASAVREEFAPGSPFFLARFVGLNGLEYARIARDGYVDRPGALHESAFFPAYPLAGRSLSALTGLPIECALLLISHASLLLTFAVLYRYADERSCGIQPGYSEYVLLALGLWPTTVFFRMVHSEALFLLLSVAAMYAMQRQARFSFVAGIIGLATACRPVGVALLAPFALYLWQQTPSISRFLRAAAIQLPLACWGLAAFMLYQYLTLGDALAFADAQQAWGKRIPHPSYLEQWGRALILQPIWEVYDSSSIAYWQDQEGLASPFMSLAFANPIYLGVSAALVVLGWRMRWLNGRELLLCAGLLGIPYVTHSYRFLMCSQGRCAAVAFPIYLVVGQVAIRAPRIVLAVVAAACACCLALYAALFAAGYRII